jgi:exodeoxyribonuclease V beta subunit
MKELDHLNVALSGRNLIEASAGTGKTYAIACLYLRLLIEKDLLPEQILVVTYTEAATEELRGRIRNRIREALQVFSGSETNDAFLAGLSANSNGNAPDRAKSRDNLDRALKSFDTASIFTIHGFCLRALQDNAFESGSHYDTELVTDQSELLQETVDDFWRMHFFSRNAPLLGYALRSGCSPEKFMQFVEAMLSNPKLEVIPRFDADAIATVEQVCRSAFEQVRNLWQTARLDIEHILHNDKGLSRSADNYREDQVLRLLAGMTAFVAGNNPYDLFDGFDKFCTGRIEQLRLKKHAPPAHLFFDLCGVLQTQVAQRFLALRWELVSFAGKRLRERKREINIRFFDDLLNDLYGALCGSNGDNFAAGLRGKYRSALIDEFQDTDPVQYDIFRMIYSDPDMPLFLIGDPKQAIYSFRGADIFAYLEAAADVADDRRFTLTGNWRSTPGLLTAFNTIFDNTRKPFLFDAISYYPIRSGKENAVEQLVLADADQAPLRIWYIPHDNAEDVFTVGKANDVIPAAVAVEIARLLRDGAAGKALIDGRPLLPGDIAVIVRSHRQAAMVQEALRESAIPSVMRSDKSIFATGEAVAVCTLLGALADPGNEIKVRSALVTDILGRSGDAIARLLEDEQAWEESLEKFRAYHKIWLDADFMVMSQALMAGEGVRGRLLRRPDGERRLTNLLHCFEVIHHAAHEKGLGMEGLLTWFGERVSDGEAAEEYQIRLETDEKMVKIVTVHVSKGLEYPVVFCPFMWGGIRSGEGVATFHDRFIMKKDFGSPDYQRHLVLARKESLAESLRLLYVALTRAKFRCYLFAGKVTDKSGKNRPETSPLSYLFHASAATGTAADPVAQLAGEVAGLTAQDMEGHLRTLAEKGQGSIAVTRMPEVADADYYMPLRDEAPLAHRSFTGAIRSDWRVASFTSFSAHESAAVELADRDETGSADTGAAGADVAELPEGKSIFTFPRGAQAGIFLHGLFEGLDFAGYSPATVSSQVEKGLAKYGYDQEWHPHVRAMVDNVVTTPIPSVAENFSLAGLERGNWLVELEFFFPLRFITSDILRNVLKKWSGADQAVDLVKVCRELRFRPAQGMVRGFMDMVFRHDQRYYLLDWKSNHLGYRVEDYGRNSLKGAMERQLYPLQYLLYTVALNRYLSLRDNDYSYASHFGGVLYVFLRGVTPERGEDFGIFRDTPPAAMIDELTECLIQAGG